MTLYKRNLSASLSIAYSSDSLAAPDRRTAKFYNKTLLRFGSRCFITRRRYRLPQQLRFALPIVLPAQE